MAIEDQSEGTKSNTIFQAANRASLDMGETCTEGAHLKNQFPSVNEYAPKVRKPYTISKQREKWTEEEHKKFIESLKLYGRAWRRIEEHVGTKTAVQIRSHAQKFFTKVVRESDTDGSSPVKPIEIPPPRPKRKPLHPYPRKMVALSKTVTLAGEQPRRSTSPNTSKSEHDNQSPTSVLSAAGSETFDTSDLNTQNGSPSPVSSANGVNVSCFSAYEPNSYPIESESALLDQQNESSEPDEEVPMKLELFPQESISGSEGQVEVAPVRSLKLFGKTVLVSESHRPSSPTKGTCEMNDLTPVCSFDWRSMSTGFSSLPSLVSHGYIRDPLHIPVPTKADSLFITHGRGVCSGSSISSPKNEAICMSREFETQTCQVSSDNEEKKSLLRLARMRNDNTSSPRGFVPYKRCLAERDSQSSSIATDEREEQRMRLCL